MSSAMLRSQKIIVMKGVLGPFTDEETEAPFQNDLLKTIENERQGSIESCLSTPAASALYHYTYMNISFYVFISLCVCI